MSEIQSVTVYADSIVYDLGGRSLHDFHGNGEIREGDDKICVKNNPDPCYALNFPKPTSNDQEILSRFRKLHPDYVNQVVNAATNIFRNNISWERQANGQHVATTTLNEGTVNLTDRNGDGRVDIFEFVPNSSQSNNPFEAGLKLYRDYYDAAFDHKEDRPVKNPLSSPFLDKIAVKK